MTAQTDTETWIEANSDWLTADHQPMVGQLRMLADSMDAERAAKGFISAASANAYRMAYRTLMEVKHLGERTDPTGGPNGLFSPAGDPGSGF